ncbi:YolD-like family protein [Bacillus velezensis]|nr:YolD-like family protein [Bacillus velezensis]WEV80230.1 YolD-like family protein [Bacillus velezensis]
MNPNKLTPGYNVMWESSRMMRPNIGSVAKKRKEREFRPPELSEEQLNDMNRIIAASIEEDRAISVTYASAHGPRRFWGWVKQVMHDEKRLKIINDEDALTLPFHRILSAELE